MYIHKHINNTVCSKKNRYGEKWECKIKEGANNCSEKRLPGSQDEKSSPLRRSLQYSRADVSHIEIQCSVIKHVLQLVVVDYLN